MSEATAGAYPLSEPPRRSFSSQTVAAPHKHPRSCWPFIAKRKIHDRLAFLSPASKNSASVRHCLRAENVFAFFQKVALDKKNHMF